MLHTSRPAPASVENMYSFCMCGMWKVGEESMKDEYRQGGQRPLDTFFNA